MPALQAKEIRTHPKEPWAVLKSEKPEQRAIQLIWTKEEVSYPSCLYCGNFMLMWLKNFGDFSAKSFNRK